MRLVRSFPALVVLLVLAAACAHTKEELADAERRLERGELGLALAEFDRVAARAKAPPADRVRAWTGGALACQRWHDLPGARARLEQAARSDIPGASEPAMYYLADLIRFEDRARALNLYYRAAAGAEKHRARGFPYQAAMDRILQLSIH
jgi:hypothetical protein